MNTEENEPIKPNLCELGLKLKELEERNAFQADMISALRNEREELKEEVRRLKSCLILNL